MLPLSVIIIARNEEQNLERLLPLLQPFAKEIVVFDSQSEDNTADVARRFGAQVHITDWPGSVLQKQRALDAATQPWIWSLDCDELPDEELLKSVRQVVGHNRAGAFSLHRRTVYLGKRLRHAWQPDVHLRLVHRSLHPRIMSVNGHDAMTCDVAHYEALNGWLDHYSYRDISHHFEKTLYYAKLGADAYFTQGRRFSYLNLLLNPTIAFIKMGIIRGALLDGLPGFLATISTWLHVLLKYAMLREHEQNAKKSGRTTAE